jgi:hypothetical protein
MGFTWIKNLEILDFIGSGCMEFLDKAENGVNTTPGRR